MTETKKIIMINMELPVELNERIYDVLDDMGGISRAAFIRQAILSLLKTVEPV